MPYLIGTRQLPSCPVPKVNNGHAQNFRGARGVSGPGHPTASLGTRRELPRPVTSIGFSPSAMCLVGGSAGLPLNTLPTGVAGNSLDRREMDGSYLLHRSQALPKSAGMNHLTSVTSPRSRSHQIEAGILPPHHQLSESEEDEEDWC